MVHLRTARLSNWQKWLICVSGVALWLTGAVWLLLHYYGAVEGEFGPEMSPLEPLAMKLHGLFVIPALLGIGTTSVAHIGKGWTHRRQRLVGLLLCAVLAVLVLSGYLLYYAGGELTREWSSLAHWTIGLLLPAILAWHWISGIAARRNGQRPPGNAKP